MPKFDDFDLDLKQSNTSKKDAEPQVTSLFRCTPGTCNNTCKGDSTFHSNCCGGSLMCSLGGC